MSQISIHNEAIAEAIEFSKNLFGQYQSHWVKSGEDRGMWRPGYSKQESEAHQFTINAVKDLGVEVYQDLAGNSYMVKPGVNRYAPVVMSGSHLDAVPRGGAYDGPAGVVIAAASIKALTTQWKTPPQDYVAVAWRNEESTSFAGQYGIGSKLAVGKLSSEFLINAKKRETGELLVSHMHEIGLHPDKLMSVLKYQGKLLPQEIVGRAVEFHIEQGDELAEGEKQIGLVDSIRASLRFPEFIQFHGEAGHTGALPMYKRHSAGMAMSEFIVATSKRLKELSQSMDLVYEPSIIETPGATQTSVVKQARMKFDIRSTSAVALDKSYEIVKEEAVRAARNNGCLTNAETMKVSLATPQDMSDVLCNDFAKAADQCGIAAQVMSSGANHDICSLADVSQRELIFLRHAGGSHNPDEALGLVGEDPFQLGTSFANAIKLNTHIAALPANDVLQKMQKTFGKTLQDYGAIRIA